MRSNQSLRCMYACWYDTETHKITKINFTHVALPLLCVTWLNQIEKYSSTVLNWESLYSFWNVCLKLRTNLVVALKQRYLPYCNMLDTIMNCRLKCKLILDNDNTTWLAQFGELVWTFYIISEKSNRVSESVIISYLRWKDIYSTHVNKTLKQPHTHTHT